MGLPWLWLPCSLNMGNTSRPGVAAPWPSSPGVVSACAAPVAAGDPDRPPQQPYWWETGGSVGRGGSGSGGTADGASATAAAGGAQAAGAAAGGAAGGGRWQPEGAPRWRYTSAACVEHEFGKDFIADLAVLDSLDVLVAVHGAACVDLFFTRKGSSLLELRPYEFDPW